MKLTNLLGMLGVSVALTQFAWGADAVGKVTFNGAVPAPFEMALDKTCGKMRNATKIQIHEYAVGASNALADVVIYLKGGPAGAQKTTPVVMEQKNCQYSPFISVAQANQPVAVRNSDGLMHEVRFRPTGAGNKGTGGFVQYAKAADFKFTLPTPEPFIEFTSSYQPWVRAYLYIVNTPYYTISDTNGNYTIPNLPPGNYTLVAHHLKAGTMEKAFVVAAGKNATNNIAFGEK